MMTIEQIYEIFCAHPSITIDSRTIGHDSIFFALRGANFDGNNFALECLNKGAAYCVVDSAEVAAQDDRLIWVDDTLKSLQSLAQLHRQRLNIPIVAITGSNGKTTTKELVASVLSTRYKIFATRGNFNNHIGVPLTLLSMNSSIELGVVEMGASAVGEIAELCSIAQPNYGVITNIGRAHLEGFGSEEGVKQGKGELFEWLAASEGVAFVPEEDSTINDIAVKFPHLKRVNYSYSLADGVIHNLEGDYNLKNIATAVAIASKLGVSKIFAHEAIARYSPTNNRSQRVVTESNTLIVDCYNANPSSMEASISNFAASDFADCPEGKVLILGDMLELGEWSLFEHQRVIELAISTEVKSIFLVGGEFARSYQAIIQGNERVELFDSQEDLAEHINTSPLSNSAILIKGSRGIGLEKLVDLMINH